MSLTGFQIRRYLPEDDIAFLALYTEQEADRAPLVLSRHREEREERERKQTGEAWTAELDGQPVGFGVFDRAWWTGRDDIYSATVRVSGEYERRGVGGSLFRQLLARLEQWGATELIDKVREDSERGRGFARHFGFQETGEIEEDYTLAIADASLAELEDRLEALSRLGVAVVPLSTYASDERFLQQLYVQWAALETEYREDMAEAFEVWRSQVLLGSGMSFETFWVAVKESCPIAMTFLKRLTPDSAENDFTYVVPAYRGKGIAYTLKLGAISWARANGLARFYTGSHVKNHYMIAINVRLGYVAGARRIEIDRAL